MLLTHQTVRVIAIRLIVTDRLDVGRHKYFLMCGMLSWSFESLLRRRVRNLENSDSTRDEWKIRVRSQPVALMVGVPPPVPFSMLLAPQLLAGRSLAGPDAARTSRFNGRHCELMLLGWHD